MKHDRVLEPLRPVDVLPPAEATPLRPEVGLPLLTNLDYLSAEVDGRRVRYGRPDAEPVDDVLEPDAVLFAHPPCYEYLDRVPSRNLQPPHYFLAYLAESAPS